MWLVCLSCFRLGSERCVERIKQILNTDANGIVYKDDAGGYEDFEILEFQEWLVYTTGYLFYVRA